MSLGVEVRTRTAPAGRGAFTQTDTLFVVASFTAGVTTKAVLCRSIADVEAAFAGRTAGNEIAWDYLDVYFREGGRRAYVGRYTPGPGTLNTALNTLFPEDLGPGQVAAPNETPGAAPFQSLVDHAALRSRVALLDVAVGDDTSTELQVHGTALQGLTANKEYGALFGPWVTVPAPAGSVGGSGRSVHASAVVAALIARADALGNVNRAAAGRDFPLQYASGFVGPIGQTERISLLNGGVNTFSDRYGVLQMYGFQTAVAQSDTTPFWQFNCSRTRMWMVANAKVAGESYMFKPIDARGLLARSLQSEIDSFLLELWEGNGLYGETPQEAFTTEVGASVNTDLTVAQGELHAIVEARLSLHAKRVLIDLVSVPVTGNVSQPV